MFAEVKANSQSKARLIFIGVIGISLFALNACEQKKQQSTSAIVDSGAIVEIEPVIVEAPRLQPVDGNLTSAIQSFQNGNYENIAQVLLFHANAGKSAAQFTLATMYLNGQGVEKNIEQALIYFIDAADNGHVNAPIWAGNILQKQHNDEGWSEAIRMYELGLSKANHNNALINLSKLYGNDQFSGQNQVRAAQYFARSLLVDTAATELAEKITDSFSCQVIAEAVQAETGATEQNGTKCDETAQSKELLKAVDRNMGQLGNYLLK